MVIHTTVGYVKRMDATPIAIAGAGGIVGRRLVEAWAGRGPVTVLTRRDEAAWPPGVIPFVWSPDAARRGDEPALDALAARLDGAHALVNLAGASISAGRLDAAHLARLRGSRVDVAATLLAATRRCAVPPAVWLQGSAVGLYGDRGDAVLTEASGFGAASFPLVPTGQAWEAAAEPAADLTRLVVARLGVVLDRDAEAWRRLLLPVRLFAGGPLGSGRQWMAWITGRDAARALRWLIDTPDARGVYNLTAPEPVRQIDLTRTAARALGRPVWLPAPAFALRLLLGRLADGLLLGSQRVVPRRLLEAGFAFEDPTIEQAMPTLL